MKFKQSKQQLEEIYQLLPETEPFPSNEMLKLVPKEDR